MKAIMKKLDNWGKIQTFYIEDDQEFKSHTGGYYFIFFIIFAIFYFIFQLTNFIQNIELVLSSRITQKDSVTYNLTVSDIYFGFSVFDQDNLQVNQSLLFNSYITANYNGTSTRFNLTKCNSSIFFQENWGNFNVTKRQQIKDEITSYVCPDINLFTSLTPKNFEQISQSNIILSVDMNNSTYLQNSRYSIKFIYREYMICSDLKTHPYWKYINYVVDYIDKDFSKTKKLILSPFSILDDINLFTSGNYENLNYSRTSQPNGTVFLLSESANLFQYIPNRASSNNFNLFNYEISLFNFRVVMLRDYPKFPNFLAGLGSIISNVLLILTIWVNIFKQNLLSNEISKKLFNFDRIDEFEKNFNSQDYNQIIIKNNPGAILNSKETDELRKDIEKKLVNNSPQSIDFNQLLQDNENSEKSSLKSFLVKIQNKFGPIREELNQVLFKKKSDIITDCENEIKKIFSVENLIRMDNEITLIKRALFDEDQVRVFDLSSYLMNYFSRKNENKFDISESTNSYIKISQRKSDIDKRVLDFFSAQQFEKL